MTDFLAFTIVGIVTGAIYAVAASGLVVTYTTSGVFNIAHGAVGHADGVPLLAGPLRLGLAGARSASCSWSSSLAPLFGVLVDRTLARNLARRRRSCRASSSRSACS